MSELIESLEKSVMYLRKKYPGGLPLLTDLENQLEYLKAKKENSPKEISQP